MNVTIATKIRKLPKPVRLLNLTYKILMVMLGVVNLTFTLLDQSSTFSIPVQYFEISSALLTVIPLGWSQLLDALKQYVGDYTPVSTPTNSPKPNGQTDLVKNIFNNNEIITNGMQEGIHSTKEASQDTITEGNRSVSCEVS